MMAIPTCAACLTSSVSGAREAGKVRTTPRSPTTRCRFAPPFVRPFAATIASQLHISNAQHDMMEHFLQQKEHLSDRMCFSSQQRQGLYLYRLSVPQMENGVVQTRAVHLGLVSEVSIREYIDNDRIKRHEKTKVDRETSYVKHIVKTRAHTAPVVFGYRETGLRTILHNMLQHLTDCDKIVDAFDANRTQHEIWAVTDERHISEICSEANRIPRLYIMDGHHRCAASAALAEEERRIMMASGIFTGNESSNYVLGVLFDDHDITCHAYQRVVCVSPSALADALRRIESMFEVEPQKGHVHPSSNNELGMFVAVVPQEFSSWHVGWHRLTLRESATARGEDDESDSFVSSLSPHVVDRYILRDALGVDARMDVDRVSFVPGPEGFSALENATIKQGSAIGLSLHPISAKELMDAMDDDHLLPPKSTWIEPKVPNGIIVQRF